MMTANHPLDEDDIYSFRQEINDLLNQIEKKKNYLRISLALNVVSWVVFLLISLV